MCKEPDIYDVHTEVGWGNFETWHVIADSIVLKTIDLLLIFSDGVGGRGDHKIDHFCEPFKCMTANAKRIRQSLAVLGLLGICCYLSSKKLNWFSFWFIPQITKSIRPPFGTLKIQSFLKIYTDSMGSWSESVESAGIFRS